MIAAWRISTILLLAVASCGWAQTTSPAAAAPSATVPAGYAAIREKLASDEFAIREAGQRELEKMPPSQIEALRAPVAKENDAEVVSRLSRRIEEMELYVLIHPPPLSVYLKDASLAELASSLNRQLGGNVVTTFTTTVVTVPARGGAAPAAKTINLTQDNQPFWAILTEANKQLPMAFSAVALATEASPGLRLSAQTARRDYRLWETFALTAQVSGQPETGQWGIIVAGLSDPRVRIAGYAPTLIIDKLTDQDGKSLIHLVEPGGGGASLARPGIGWTSRVSLLPVKGLTRIKDFHAMMSVTIIEKEAKISLDVTKPIEPITSPLGTITVDQNGAGDLTLKVTSPGMDAGVPAAILTTNPRPSLRTYDSAGKLQTNTILNPQHAFAHGTISRIEISWVNKTREIQIPVDWPGLEIPPPPVHPPGARIDGPGWVDSPQ